MRFGFPFVRGPVRSGDWGERQAEAALRRAGYRLIGRNVRPDDRDELDLVMRDGDVLVFVEVKTRKNETFGAPAEAVDRRKRHALSRAAVRYLTRLRRPVDFRFDVVEIIGSPGDAPVVRHIRNAFRLDRCYQLPF